MPNYNLTSDAEGKTLTVFLPTGPKVASQDHPNFAALIAAVLDNEDDETLAGLFNILVGVGTRFQRLSDRVTFDGQALYFDGDPLESDSLTDTIVAYFKAGESDYARLVSFLDKVQTNPSEHSRANLYRWLTANLGPDGFQIAPDGDLIAFKGVRREGAEDGYTYLSGHAGRAIVDGVQHDGFIPTAPGSVVEMPRSSVTFDPSVGCSFGLHAGPMDYARSYGNVVVRVKINPRDVVSVPTESGDKKMRVCRYEVLAEVESRPESFSYDPPADDQDEDGDEEYAQDEECDLCGSTDHVTEDCDEDDD